MLISFIGANLTLTTEGFGNRSNTHSTSDPFITKESVFNADGLSLAIQKESFVHSHHFDIDSVKYVMRAKTTKNTGPPLLLSSMTAIKLALKKIISRLKKAYPKDDRLFYLTFHNRYVLRWIQKEKKKL